MRFWGGCGLPVPLKELRERKERDFLQADSDSTRSNGFKLIEGRFRLDTRKEFFTRKV